MESVSKRKSRFLSVTVSVLFFCAVSLGTAFFILRLHYIDAALEVCNLIDTNYYRSAESDVQSFLRTCRSQARAQSFRFSKSANIARINDRLAFLKTSHLNVYRPEENDQIWESRAVDTGIRARFVEAELIIYRVLEGSAAQTAGLKPGDILISIDDREIGSAMSVQSLAGKYTFQRGDHLHDVKLTPVEITEDLSPKLTAISKSTAVLRLSSFLPQYFETEQWKPISDQLENYDYLIVDLRDNSGGSFPAMLRALSPFRCHDHQVGKLIGPSNATERIQSVALKDTLDASSQLTQLHEARDVEINTFSEYGCFNGPVTVLIDSGTSSTAEIFAEAFYVRQNSRVWGQPSAGQVVMAQWFQIVNFGGDDTSMSIPIAGYLSATENPIEGEGLLPEKSLNYDPSLSRRGIDSWIEQSSHVPATSHVSK